MCKAGDKCLFPHHKDNEQPNKKAKERLLFPQKKRKRRQECSGYCENCTTIGLRLARLGCVGFSKRQTVPGKPDAKSLGINSKSTVHPVHATSREYPGKGPSLGKLRVKHPHQRSHYAMKFEDLSHEETVRQPRCARSEAWNLAKTYTSSKRTTKLHSTRPRKNGYSWLRQQKELEEREFVVASGASMHLVSKRDLNFVELETMRTSRSPTTVMTANGEVQTREEATVYVKELDLFVTVMFLEETPAVLSLGALRESWVYPPLDQRSKTTSHQKGQEN